VIRLCLAVASCSSQLIDLLMEHAVSVQPLCKVLAYLGLFPWQLCFDAISCAHLPHLDFCAIWQPALVE
jgi:hypothetical protein